MAVYLTSALVSTAIALVTLRVTPDRMGVPFNYVGDAVAVGAHVKTVLETGWYENQPALGAPAGQTYHDFPTAENLHMIAFKVLGLFSDDFAVVMNVYYLLGFPLAALAGTWFLRLVGVSRPMTAVLAVLLALSPYHFERGEAHLFLASYYPVPLALGVVVLVLAGRAVWTRRRHARGPAGLLTGQGAITLLAMTLLGTASSYYSVFVLLLLGTAGIVALVRDRDLRRFAGAVGAGVALVATMLANMLPDLLYARGRDTNELALGRYAAEAEVYALKLVQLVLPSDKHRFADLREVRLTYNETFPLPSETPALGVVAAIGFVMLLGVLVWAASRRGDEASATGGAAPGRTAWLRCLSVLAAVAFTLATVGGISSLVAVFVTDALRGWSRMTILIAVLSLAAVGLVADTVLDRLGRLVERRRAQPLGSLARGMSVALACGALLLVGTVDQTSPAYRPDHAGNAAAFGSDQRYVARLEAALPVGAAVFQLPYQPFPESPPLNGVLDTDALRMYLHSSDLRWSAGALKGRPTSDWPVAVVERPTPTVVASLALAGFSGISVDRKALADAGEGLAEELTAELRTPAVRSDDDRYSFWSLDGVVADLSTRYSPAELAAARQAVLLPPVAYLKPDFFEPRPVDDVIVYPSQVADPEVLLDNPRDESVEVDLSFGLSSATGVPSALVEIPGQPDRVLDLRQGPAEVRDSLVLPPGRSVLRISVDPAVVGSLSRPARARFDVHDLRLVDPVAEDFRPLVRTGLGYAPRP